MEQLHSLLFWQFWSSFSCRLFNVAAVTWTSVSCAVSSRCLMAGVILVVSIPGNFPGSASAGSAMCMNDPYFERQIMIYEQLHCDYDWLCWVRGGWFFMYKMFSYIYIFYSFSGNSFTFKYIYNLIQCSSQARPLIVKLYNVSIWGSTDLLWKQHHNQHFPCLSWHVM